MRKSQIFFTGILRIAFLFVLTVMVACGSSNENDGLGPTDDKTDTSTSFQPSSGNDLYGQLTDEAGKGIAGVVVSDGFSCVTTDEQGYYQMKRNLEAHFVFYSVPSNYAAKSNQFYQSLENVKQRYDFQLSPLSASENHFYLLAMADPQVTNNKEIERFTTETLPDVKDFVTSASLPVYGICLGDIVNDHPENLSVMNKLLNSTKMPMYATIGNHDKVAQEDVSLPRTTTQFEKQFGPINYSFNRGQVHFVCLDDVVFTNATEYTAGFSTAQVEWLRQDLSHVDKSKMVVVYYHIPLRNSSALHREEVLSLLSGYANAVLMCGHTHYMQSYRITSPVNIEERIHGAACGAWWHSVINVDGCPNGYAIYEIDGTQVKDYYYKSTRYDRSFQIRLHRGDSTFGGDYGTFDYGLTSDFIVANVWNANDQWKLRVYENDVYTGDMINAWDYFHKDAWALGCHIGQLNRNPDNYSKNCYHDFVYKLKNPNATVKVVAIDDCGNKYEQSDFTDDLSTAMSY